MTSAALRLGPIDVGGARLNRSGLRWLCPDGYRAAANEVVAFCNIALAGDDADAAFAEESFDLQVGFAPRVAGRIRHAADASHGGYIDRLPAAAWDADMVWGRIEDVADDPETADLGRPGLLFVAGRRFTDIAEDRSGLMTGWHDRTRAWWGEGAGGTLLGAGICEQEAVLRGGGVPFADLFGLVPGPTQVVLSQDEPLVPSAGILADQLRRTPADMAEIRADIARCFVEAGGGTAPVAADWLFMGALLNGLEHVPLAEDYQLLTRDGLVRSGPADAICLSLTAELPQVARHKRLGYRLNFHNFRLRAAPDGVKRWLRANFVGVDHGPEDVERDYRALAAAAGGRPILVINAMSSPGYERIRDYRLLDAETMAGLASVRARTLNLLLHDLARDIGIGIVDADAIAAEMGMIAHLPDGVHGSGALYGAIRAELVRLLGARGVPGFVSRS